MTEVERLKESVKLAVDTQKKFDAKREADRVARDKRERAIRKRAALVASREQTAASAASVFVKILQATVGLFAAMVFLGLSGFVLLDLTLSPLPLAGSLHGIHVLLGVFAGVSLMAAQHAFSRFN